jgi:hypothetical protein
VRQRNRPINFFVVFLRGDERSHLMITRITRGALALTLLGSVALLGTPTFAVEPDVDSPAGPELPAPRTADPDFQQDDQAGAVIDPETEGANSGVAPDVIIVEPSDPANE